jgi:hypothetical protein
MGLQRLPSKVDFIFVDGIKILVYRIFFWNLVLSLFCATSKLALFLIKFQSEERRLMAADL